MGCRIEGSAPKIHNKPIVLEPRVPTPAPATVTDSNACPPSVQECDGYGSVECTSQTSCSGGSGLPMCPPDLVDADGKAMCPPCIPPDAVMIRATPRDPYYVDELAVAMDQTYETMTTVRINIDGNIPLVRPLAFRSAALPGVNGVPRNVRSDIETHELEHQAVNMYSTIPQSNGKRREVAVIDRFNNRWVIVNSIAQDPIPIFTRVSPSYYSRGRGVAPWWKTGYPDGSSSTGVS